jgi:hypothetical protein
MATTLQDTLFAPERRSEVITDCMTLIQQEVSDLSGISGTAIKIAYKTVTALAADHVRYTVETKVPRMVEQLEPYWVDFAAAGGSDFGDYLTKHSDAVTESLLSVTDASAAKPTAKPAIVKAYSAVRSHAAKHVTTALPRVGALVQKYALPGGPVGGQGERSGRALPASTDSPQASQVTCGTRRWPQLCSRISGGPSSPAR